ncbi:mannose-1-phosphate guanylyltransferase [Marinococcus halophilus]|uniref:Mannose-1-phosphate guanylyltransferase n=1 Tax=Marinococcus halophilus TaxID=1371 RepID=A0A510Y324_MARHA|nr:sugar phosphate nucleotidyltransferase [Marinococcus halophilus]OZT81760.1 mannose-1-phosphate guanylyltransferase [Marinococcus halophilus]GEK57719.1 mannose-1-phosphate guanylyltransferase [Marinococcus halophilus]
MRLVLLSGGSGKRLWPLSNDTRSKQFLKVLDGPDGEKESMVQRVWRQLEACGLASSAVIATSESQKDLIKRQLGENVPLVMEPERRDTFAAVALAASYLFSVEKASPEEVIVMLPVDAFVDTSFFENFELLERLIQEGTSDMALIGVKPVYPSTKYGYIVPGSRRKGTNAFAVEAFTEKPGEDRARELIECQALWNCGVFGFTMAYLLSILEEEGLPFEYELLKSQYHTVPKTSFDYRVVEKAEKVTVLQYEGDWKDLGTWNTLTEEMAANQTGKGVISESSVNTHLVNELDIPVAVIDASDMVIVSSPDGIIVASKESSSQIKELIKDFRYPQMYEERLWGWSRVLDYAKYPDGQMMITKRILLERGKNSTLHYHHNRDEVWTVVRGEGEIAVDNHMYRIKAGDVVHLPAGTKHALRATSDLEIVEVQTGMDISNDDIIRIHDTWDDVLRAHNGSAAKFIK